MSLDTLDAEIELITASLLPAEHLNIGASRWPRTFDILSDESELTLVIDVQHSYPDRESVRIQVKGPDIGREEAEGWRVFVEQHLQTWDQTDEYPLFQILSVHFLPLLASPPPKSPSPLRSGRVDDQEQTCQRYHVLITSHHLLSPTKRKNLVRLSSELSLVGFSKIGHPGIMYAQGSVQDLQEWLKEVKSWNWLALKAGGGIEAIPADGENHDGADDLRRVSVPNKGEWTEVEKVAEALEWMRKRGMEEVLTNIGIGGGA